MELPSITPTLRRAGFSADLCPFCHGVAVFEVLRHGETIEYYGLKFGKGWLHRFEARCRCCGWTKVVEPDAYARLLEHPEGTVPEMLLATNPELPRREARAFAFERALRERALTAEERHEAVERVFDAAETSSRTEKSSPEGALSQYTRWRYLYLPLLVFLLGIPLLLSGWLPEEAAFPVLLGLFALPIVGGLVGWITYPYRFARFVLRPLIVRGLVPLGAAAAEIEVAARRRRWRDHGAAYKGLGKDAT